jgi:hypothetical protein
LTGQRNTDTKTFVERYADAWIDARAQRWGEDQAANTPHPGLKKPDVA